MTERTYIAIDLKSFIEPKEKFEKNAVLKGMNLENSATARERNRQTGGYKA